MATDTGRARETEEEGAEAAAPGDRPRLDGVPTVTAAESIAVDALAEQDGLTMAGLLSRCGYLTAQVVLNELADAFVQKEAKDSTVTVLAGTGHKGAAALIAGRHLAEAGWTINVVLARPAKEYQGETKDALTKVERMAKKVYGGYNERAFDQADLILDGLIGAGITGAPKASVSLLVKGANFSMKPIVAVDLPSGLDATTGLQSAVAIKASATVAVGLPKRGMLGKSNMALCGRIFVIDIGIPPALWEKHLGLDVSDVFDGQDYVELGAAERVAAEPQ